MGVLRFDYSKGPHDYLEKPRSMALLSSADPQTDFPVPRSIIESELMCKQEAMNNSTIVGEYVKIVFT